MKSPGAGHVSDEVRAAAELVQQRVPGDLQIVAENGWTAFADALGVVASENGRTPMAVGSNDHVIGVLSGAEAAAAERAGFVTWASARPAVWWRRFGRGRTRFLDPTKRIWSIGWTPLSVARIEVEIDDAIVELVIGDARPRPNGLEGASAFD